MSLIEAQVENHHFKTLIKINCLGWLIFFVLFNCYCLFWREYGVNLGFTFADSFTWYFKEWGTWTLLSPALLFLLEVKFRSLSVWVTRVLATVLFMLVVFSTRVLLNSGEYPADTSAALVHLFPKYMSGLIIFIGAWLFIQKHLTQKLISEQRTKTEVPPSITIEHNGLNTQVRFDDIISIKTAGNYIELETRAQTYLTRTTLKALLAELPPQHFQQVHRSFVININKLQKLTHLENGGGKAFLSNQQSIPVSKRYKSQLKSLIIPDLQQPS